MLIRFGEDQDPFVVIKSQEQIHKFNTPYQVTRLPSALEIEQLKRENKRKELEQLTKALKERAFFQD